MQLIKYLQSQGIGSRKQCQWLIQNDCVEINDTVYNDAKADIDPAEVQTLRIDGEDIVVVPMPYFYILLNKPADYETSHKPQQYPSVFSLFPDHMRNIDMQAVGRLDADTTGVLLITNDGQFNHRVTSPKHKVPKIYRVTLKHPADDSLCETLKKRRPAARRQRNRPRSRSRFGKSDHPADDHYRRQISSSQTHGRRRRQPRRTPPSRRI